MNVIETGVVLGKQIVIGHFNVIKPGVVIGDHVIIGSHVTLYSGTIIKAGAVIDDGVHCSGDCTIGEGSRIRYDSVIARGVDIADNVFLAPKVVTLYTDHKGNTPARRTQIGRNVFIGAGAVLLGGVQIAADVVIGAVSLVRSDCLEPGIYIGIPAERMKQ